MSIGRTTVPLMVSNKLGLVVSLQVTVVGLDTEPPNPAELNCSGIMPVWPGATSRSHLPELVQPHPGLTSVIWSVAVPVFVTMKSCLTNSPLFAFPKSNSVLWNSIFGVPAVDAGAGGSAQVAQHPIIIAVIPIEEYVMFILGTDNLSHTPKPARQSRAIALHFCPPFAPAA